MIRPLLLAAALLTGTQAAALSCRQPDPIEGFGWAEESPDRHVVLLGRLDFDPALLEPVQRGLDADGAIDLPEPPPPVTARFEGRSLTTRGFVPSAIDTVTLRTICVTGSCGTLQPGENLLFFAREAAGGWELELSPCGSVFADPSRKVLRALAACLRGAACEAP